MVSTKSEGPEEREADDFSRIYENWENLIQVLVELGMRESRTPRYCQMKIFDDILVRYTDEELLPNTFAGIADSRGEIYTGAAGKNIDHRAALYDAVVAIASMTKPVTTVAALQLAEQLLDLDAPVTDYIPELSELKVLKGSTEAGVLVLTPVPPTTSITVHTSGFVCGFWNANARLVEGGAEVFSLRQPVSRGPFKCRLARAGNMVSGSVRLGG